jgi:membrane-associated protease RseP (regulator of RpoE activity)
MLSGLLLFGVVIMITIGVHEYGHYLAMVRNGVRVVNFQINVGPVLKRWTLKSGTVFSIHLIPIGGLARPVEEGPDGIVQASRWARFKIYVAGMMMNCLLAMLIILIMGYGFGVSPAPVAGIMKTVFPGVAGPLKTVVAAFVGSFGMWLATPVMLWEFFSNMVSPENAIVGPVGIAHMGTQVAQHAQTFRDLFLNGMAFLWLINIAVAQMNAIPIPALDGGRIAMLLFERWLSPTAQRMLVAGSMLALLALVLYATWNDILRILAG